MVSNISEIAQNRNFIFTICMLKDLTYKHNYGSIHAMYPSITQKIYDEFLLIRESNEESLVEFYKKYIDIFEKTFRTH